MRSFDVLVLGAGIVGAACARSCALAGMRVGVVEPSIPGGAATAAGMGHLVVMDDSPAQFALTKYSRGLWAAMRDELPAAVEFEARGTLWVAADAEEMAEVAAKQRLCAAQDVRSAVLDERALAEAEPELRPGLAGGLLVPEDAVVYPPAAAAFFLRQAMERGAEVMRGYGAVSAGGGRVALADGNVLSAGHIIVATGVDLALLPSLPIQPRKGHLVITERHPGMVHHQLVELGYLKSAHAVQTDSVAFNVQPRATGQLLIGSSRQYGDRSAAVEGEILRRMLARACEFMPGLREVSSLRVWTGFRAATADKLPLIGAMPEDGSLLLAMGFEGLGITNSMGAAALLTDHLLRRQTAIDAAPYRPDRLKAAVEMAHA